ncbi:hypothetical protein A1O1_01790 [Capronia coronata CBS 617.96]|uniref:Luciferase domain-containing protein n=1 Tax=Capronia coronata CBS 617.96 TaxID=1182541 RepID=W9YLI5_9EURO|nr:uncharacterized protein A1O1_01790 [Capronia coronata CBS 617.96]EXJ93398.1 hypothetical protein A1O1_01790 [Capronia coronata CBS 617.96]
MAAISSTISAYYNKFVNTIKARPRNAAITSTALALAISLAWVVQDFHDWKAFGTGGTPPTWAGYWRMTKIRVNRRIHTLLQLGKDDLIDASTLSASGPKYLDPDNIPVRGGKRPQLVSRTMPQRQVPYKSDAIEPGVAERVSDMTAIFAARYSDILDLKPSKTEGGSADAIYAKLSLPTLNERAKRDRILTTEIAHHHPSELSFHVWLSEADAKTVVEKGWGQRFPMASVDKGWTMVYAPRTMPEVDVVERIVKAGIAWVSGVVV